MSALPSSVKAQVERANALMAEIKNGQPPNGDPPADGQGEGGAHEQVDTGAPADSQQDQQAQAAAAAPPAESWEQRFKVLQGKYNAEVPRLQNQLRELAGSNRTLQEQVTATNALLASLGGPGQRPAPNTAQAAPQPERLVKDEEIREYGADLIDVVKRAAREAVVPEIDRRIDQRVQPVTQKVDTVATQATRMARRMVKQDEASVHALLTEHVPNWQQLDTDDGFLAWLDQTDPFSGRMRGEMLNEAYRAFDGPRVVAFFKSYLNEHAAVTPPAKGQPAARNGNGATPTVRLEDMVAPGTPKPGAASTQDGASNKRIWSRAEISEFYRLKQAGRFRADPKKAAALEADLFAAQREGRIR